jgi:hypothetical protein
MARQRELQFPWYEGGVNREMARTLTPLIAGTRVAAAYDFRSDRSFSGIFAVCAKRRWSR